MPLRADTETPSLNGENYQMRNIDGGNTAGKIIGVSCVLTGVAFALTGFSIHSFGWALGLAIGGGVCSGFGLAAALESKKDPLF